MKFLSWMQRKLKGGKDDNRSKATEAPVEFISPDALFAIGTFGNVDELKDQFDAGELTDHENDDPSHSQTGEIEDCAVQDDCKFREKLTELLLQNETQLLQSEKLSNWLMRSEGGRTDGDSDEKDEAVERKISLMIDEWKGDNEKISKKSSIVKRSISLLVNKIFVCGSGFSPPDSLPPPPPPPLNLRETLEDSRMKKIMRILVEKKIFPRNSSSQMCSLKRYIKEKDKPNPNGHDCKIDDTHHQN